MCSISFSTKGRCCHSTYDIAFDWATSCSKMAICRAAKSLSVMLRLASSFREKDRRSKLVDPTDSVVRNNRIRDSTLRVGIRLTDPRRSVA